jgi:hypothetical protein
MSLETPDKIRNLQRKLYCKAKAEPAFRFYLLYDKICREDILRHAYALARANAGAPGVDGVTFAQIDAYGVDAWLAGVREEIVSKTYRPEPVRRVMIPKPGGGERPLGIPTIRDRVVQTAAKIVLEPIFEADFEDSAYGQTDTTSAMVYYPSCLAAADIVQGKHPAADSEDAAKQLKQAAICFGAVTAIMNLEPFFKPEFAMCPPADSKVSFAQMVLAITTHLKNHPEQLRNNFHQLAATALAASWPCSK